MIGCRSSSPPDDAEELQVDILKHFPSDMAVARAVAQTIISRVRSPVVFGTLLQYSQSLLNTIDHEQLALVRNLTRASHSAQPSDKRRWLSQMINLLGKVTDPDVTATISHCSAFLAEPSHYKTLLDLFGPEKDGEHVELHKARHIIRRKQNAKLSTSD